jgi:hypothetical protein
VSLSGLGRSRQGGPAGPSLQTARRACVNERRLWTYGSVFVVFSFFLLQLISR